MKNVLSPKRWGNKFTRSRFTRRVVPFKRICYDPRISRWALLSVVRTKPQEPSRWRPAGNGNLRHVEPREDEHNEKAASSMGMKETDKTCRGRSRDLRGPFSRTVKYLINPLLALSDVAGWWRPISRGVSLLVVGINFGAHVERWKKESLMNKRRLIKNEVTGNGDDCILSSFLSTWTERARFHVSLATSCKGNV